MNRVAWASVGCQMISRYIEAFVAERTLPVRSGACPCRVLRVVLLLRLHGQASLVEVQTASPIVGYCDRALFVQPACPCHPAFAHATRREFARAEAGGSEEVMSEFTVRD